MPQHHRFRSCLLSSLLVLAGCATGKPGLKVDVCVLNAHEGALDCVAKDGSPYTRPVSGADNYTCFSPSDLEALLNYCK